MKPGLSIAAAQERLDALVESLKKQYPAEYPAQAAWAVRLIPLSESVVGSVYANLLIHAFRGGRPGPAHQLASTSPI